MIFPDGSVRWQQWSDRAIYNNAGNLIEYQSVGRDITDLMKMEQALIESEQRYRNVVEDQTEFISPVPTRGHSCFCQRCLLPVFRHEARRDYRAPVPAKIPADDQERVNAFLASLTPDHPVDTIEHRIIMPDGALRWQQWSDHAIFDPSGAVTEYQSVRRDITEKKATEEALRLANRQLNLFSSITRRYQEPADGVEGVS